MFKTHLIFCSLVIFVFFIGLFLNIDNQFSLLHFLHFNTENSIFGYKGTLPIIIS